MATPTDQNFWERQLTVKMSHNENNGNCYIDFWDGEKYIVSIKLNESIALNISRELNIKIEK